MNTTDNTVSTAANSALLEALQAQLMAVALQGLIREGKDAALLHLAQVETGAAELHFLVRITGAELNLLVNFYSQGGSTPMMTAKLTGPHAGTH